MDEEVRKMDRVDAAVLSSGRDETSAANSIAPLSTMWVN